MFLLFVRHFPADKTWPVFNRPGLTWRGRRRTGFCDANLMLSDGTQGSRERVCVGVDFVILNLIGHPWKVWMVEQTLLYLQVCKFLLAPHFLILLFVQADLRNCDEITFIRFHNHVIAYLHAPSKPSAFTIRKLNFGQAWSDSTFSTCFWFKTGNQVPQWWNFIASVLCLNDRLSNIALSYFNKQRNTTYDGRKLAQASRTTFLTPLRKRGDLRLYSTMCWQGVFKKKKMTIA